ncbi:MAG: hypothetical protein WCI73_10070, partial [Phycisphaerae bacterium]
MMVNAQIVVHPDEVRLQFREHAVAQAYVLQEGRIQRAAGGQGHGAIMADHLLEGRLPQPRWRLVQVAHGVEDIDAAAPAHVT